MQDFRNENILKFLRQISDLYKAWISNINDNFLSSEKDRSILYTSVA